MAELPDSKKGSPKEQLSFRSNLAEFEKAFRELKSELYMKRNEVIKLKSDLEEAHRDNHRLKAYVDNLKKSSEENKITMEMFMKRTQDFEPKYFEKRDALTRLELQYKMETAKNNTLREDFQKIVMEKSELVRKVDMLEEKRKRDLMYTNDISEKLGQLRNVVVVIKSELQTLKEEQDHVNSLFQMVDLAQESAQKCQELSEFIKRMRLENKNLEEQCVKYKAKSEKLESFIAANTRIIKEDNLEARVLLTQCKKMSSHYKQLMEIKNATIASLDDNLCQERETNIKLLEESENKSEQTKNLEKQIEDLKTKLNLYEQKPEEKSSEIQHNTPDESIVKVESQTLIIELNDSE